MNAFVEQTSQTYFPSWIYDRYHRGEDIDLKDVTDDEKIIVKKMVITASWCIQIKPSERPSMSKVLEMFETDVTLLQMPPRPFQLPFEVSTKDQSCTQYSRVRVTWQEITQKRAQEKCLPYSIFQKRTNIFSIPLLCIF